MKKIYFLLTLISNLVFAQQEFSELKVKSYSPRLYLQRNTTTGGYIQGIQTQLLNGTDNWFFGNLGENKWIVSKGDYKGIKFSITNNGNVGIGSRDPKERLDVDGNLRVDNGSNHSFIRLGKGYNNNIISDSSPEKHYGGGYFFRVHNESLRHKYTDVLMLTENGFVGVANRDPKERLDVNGNLKVDNGSNHSFIKLGKNSNNNIISDSSPEKHYGGGYFFRVHNESLPHKYTDALILAENGNVGIASRNPKYKLDVNGTIHSKEVKVDMDGWADFVFKENYNLPTLLEVEKHIQEKGHLQNIPSEKEVIENGLSLAENQKLLLQKIEELTLYIIEQNKRIEQLEKTK